MIKSYLAINYSGNEDDSYQKCIEICSYLYDRGIFPYSPILQNHPIDQYKKRDPEFYYDIDMKFIESIDFDVLILCDEWRTSKGCIKEKAWFDERKKLVIELKTIKMMGVNAELLEIMSNYKKVK